MGGDRGGFMLFGLGETILDIIFRDDQPVSAVPGGSTFNAMISLGRAGVDCEMFTEVGDDHVGDLIINYMKANGVSTRLVNRRKGSQSHLSLAFLNERNDAEYQFYKDHANAEVMQLVPEITADDVLLFGSFFAVNPVIRDRVLPIVRNAHDAGAVIYYDVNFRKSHIKDIPLILDNIHENMSLATVVRGSLEDFTYLYNLEDAESVYREYVSKHCPFFICTNGGNPIEVFTPQGHYSFPAHRVQTVSTIGAGDNFNAGFLYALTRNHMQHSLLHSQLSESQLSLLVSTAQLFSADVCASVQNSISDDLVKRLKCFTIN